MLRRCPRRDRPNPDLIRRTATGAVAGTLAAGVYLAAMYADVALSGHQYDDVQVIGKFVTHGPVWPIIGVAGNLLLGVAVGASYGALGERLMPGPQVAKGLIFGQAENLTLYPVLAPLVDRFHPDIRAGRLPRMMTRPSFLQSLPRHVAFGAALGLLYPRLLRR